MFHGPMNDAFRCRWWLYGNKCCLGVKTRNRPKHDSSTERVAEVARGLKANKVKAKSPNERNYTAYRLRFRDFNVSMILYHIRCIIGSGSSLRSM
jgi:hypothetical protein